MQFSICEGAVGMKRLTSVLSPKHEFKYKKKALAYYITTYILLSFNISTGQVAYDSIKSPTLLAITIYYCI